MLAIGLAGDVKDNFVFLSNTFAIPHSHTLWLNASSMHKFR